MAEKESKDLQLFYGPGFPGLETFDKPLGDLTEAEGQKWVQWINNRIREQEPVMRARHLHAARHRLFKMAQQWISTRDGKSWRTPTHDKSTLRVTLNLVGPALDYRLGVLREQRPGFRYEPIGITTEAKETAQAQQTVVEYYYHTQRAWVLFADAWQAAQTDGVAWLHVYIDRDRAAEQRRVELVGEDDERFVQLQAAGYHVRPDGRLELPLDESGLPLEPGQQVVTYKGEIVSRVVYAHETIADPDAKTINGPYDPAKWFIIRRPRDIESARIETGNKELRPAETTEDDIGVELPEVAGVEWQRGLPPWPHTRLQPKNVVYEYLIFLARSKQLPKGAWLKIIGNKIIGKAKSLPGGVIPIARITDGSSDPSLYPRPVMSDWVGDQVAINALASQILQHVRVWGSGRLISQKDTTLGESWTSVTGSVVTYSGVKPEVLPAPGASGDAWQLLTFLIKKFEDKSGWNDIARGQVAGGSGSSSFQDVSGRAILGARELFERTLGPMVRAAADGVTEWAELVVDYAKYLYDTPRMLPIVGGRTDLAKKIDSEMLGSRPVVYCDPETLIPLPRALRNQMLFDLYKEGIISLSEYKSRAPFALVQDVYSGEAHQWKRAQLVNEVLIERFDAFDQMASIDPLMPFLPENGIPVLWADDPMVHQNALMELILDDRKPWKMRRLALERYSIYQELAAAQQPPMGVDPTTGLPIHSPVPVEVIGAPPELPRKQQPSAVRPATGEAPGAPIASSAATELTGGGGASLSAQQTPQPLGEFGEEERLLAGGVDPVLAQ